MAQALTGNSNAGSILEDLYRRQLFTHRAGGVTTTYTYHALFREFLHDRIRLVYSDAEREALTERAASAMEAGQLPLDAIDLYSQAGRWERAASLVELAWPAWRWAVQSIAWLDWAKALPQVVVRTRPVLSVAYAQALLNAGQLEAAEDQLLDAERWLETMGTLNFVDNAVDTATGTVLLKATFPNQDERLWPGEFVDLTVILGEETGRVVCPAAAVQTGQQGQYVFTVKDDRTVELRPVRVSRIDEQEAVIDEGLQAGETVVTDGQLRLGPGAAIEVKGAQNPGGAGP